MAILVDDDSGIYAMLRAWVEGDPEKAALRAQTTVAAPEASSSNNRKSLLQYIAMETGSRHKNNKTPTKPAETEDGGPQKASSPRQSIKTNEMPPPIDLLEWLDTDDEFWLSIPFYPTLEESEELARQIRAKKKAKAARKRRRAAAIERLKKKGIRI